MHLSFVSFCKLNKKLTIESLRMYGYTCIACFPILLLKVLSTWIAWYRVVCGFSLCVVLFRYVTWYNDCRGDYWPQSPYQLQCRPTKFLVLQFVLPGQSHEHSDMLVGHGTLYTLSVVYILPCLLIVCFYSDTKFS